MIARASAVDAISRFALTVLSCFIVGCGAHILGDEGEWLGERIGRAADQLRHSTDAESVISYAPESGVNQRYSIGIGRSVWCPKPPCFENQGALTVEVERGRHGSTTYHMTFVAVPKPLEIQKTGEETQLVLRKNGSVIELVALR